MYSYRIKEHNAPLHQMMEARGCFIYTHPERGTTSYYDADGNYESYPIGFITQGVCVVSIRKANGSWVQRRWGDPKVLGFSTEAEAVTWALGVAQTELALAASPDPDFVVVQCSGPNAKEAIEYAVKAARSTNSRKAVYSHVDNHCESFAEVRRIKN